MNKLLLLILINVSLLFIDNTQVQSMDSAALSFEQAIDNGNINYIFLKRGHDKTIYPLSIKRVFCIFAALDKILGGNGLLEIKREFWKANDYKDSELRAFYAMQEEKDSQTIDAIFDQEILKITSPIWPVHSNPKKWTIIVFSETFFSSSCALDSASVDEIIKCCNALTARYRNLIVCINFLHKYNFLFHLYDRVFRHPSRPYLFSPPLPFSLDPVDPIYCIQASVQKELLSERNKNNYLRFSNYSLVVWNGMPISCYRKTIYHTEQDLLASIDYGFDFGSWDSDPTIELSGASLEHKAIAGLFNRGKSQIVSMRICADIGHMPLINDKIKLLIVQANGVPQYNWSTQKDATTKCCMIDTSNTGTFFLKKGTIAGLGHDKKEIPCHFINSELKCTVEIYGRGIFGRRIKDD